MTTASELTLKPDISIWRVRLRNFVAVVLFDKAVLMQSFGRLTFHEVPDSGDLTAIL